MTNGCCAKEENWVESEKHKDVVTTYEGFYYTVYISYCKECGTIREGGTWVE